MDLVVLIGYTIALLISIVGVIVSVVTHHREYVAPGLWMIGVMLTSLMLRLTTYPAALGAVGPTPLLEVAGVTLTGLLMVWGWMWNAWVRLRPPIPPGIGVTLIGGLGTVGGRPYYADAASWLGVLAVLVVAFMPIVLVFGIIWTYRRPRE